MSKFSKLLLSTTVGCMLHLTCASLYTYASSSEAPTEDSMLGEESVQKIQQALQDNKATLRTLSGKDIIAFLGDTGSGKSTLINLLASVPLRTDTRGNVITQESEASIKIGSGGRSITKRPQYLEVEGVGVLCDFPGFEDTDGALDDLINAAFIRHILVHAHSIKTVFVTSGPEIEAVRGASFKRLLLAMKMFSDPSFHHSSSLLVVNKFDRDQLNFETVGSALREAVASRDSLELSSLQSLLQESKIVAVPKSRYGDKADFLLRAKQNLFEKLKEIEGVSIRPESLNMAMTFNAETAGILVTYFYKELENILGQNPSILQENKEKSFRSLEELVFQSNAFRLLLPFSSRQYETAIKNFIPYFEREHDLYQQRILAERTRRDAEIAETKRLEAERQQIQAQRRAEAAMSKAQELEEAKLKAVNDLAVARAQARRIEQDAAHTKKEKEEALRLVIDAERSKQSAEQKALEQTRLLQTLREQQQKSLQQMQDLEAARQRAAVEAATIESRLRQQYEAAARSKEGELANLHSYVRQLQREREDMSSLRRRIAELERDQGNVRDLRDQIRRLEARIEAKDDEIRELRSRGQNSGGGNVVLVQTPFGLQFMRL